MAERLSGMISITYKKLFLAKVWPSVAFRDLFAQCRCLYVVSKRLLIWNGFVYYFAFLPPAVFDSDARDTYLDFLNSCLSFYPFTSSCYCFKRYSNYTTGIITSTIFHICSTCTMSGISSYRGHTVFEYFCSSLYFSTTFFPRSLLILFVAVYHSNLHFHFLG